MKRNYAAALQDDAQQTLNEWLKTKQEVSLEATASKRLPGYIGIGYKVIGECLPGKNWWFVVNDWSSVFFRHTLVLSFALRTISLH
jgi:hypothetical protein